MVDDLMIMIRYSNISAPFDKMNDWKIFEIASRPKGKSKVGKTRKVHAILG
jgi:hypothetical protein